MEPLFWLIGVVVGIAIQFLIIKTAVKSALVDIVEYMEKQGYFRGNSAE